MTSEILPSPRKIWYISAWVLTLFISYLFSVLAKVFIYSKVSMFAAGNVYWIVVLSPVVNYSAWLIVAVLIYLLFSQLEISKVIPWVWAMGLLGVLDDISKFLNDENKSVVEITILTSTVLSFILSVLAFIWFFKTFKFYRY